MKNFLLLIAALALTANASAGVNANDTVVVEKPNVVTIVTTDSLQSIRVEGEKDNPSYTYQSQIQLTDSNYTSETAINSSDFTFSFGMPKNASKKEVNHSREIVGTSNLYFGFTSLPGLSPGELQLKRSMELWWVIMNLEYSPWKKGWHTFSLGIGVDWRVYGLTKANRFVKADGKLAIGDYPEGVRPKYSNLKVFSLNFPLLYNFTPDKDCRMSIGPVFNFNTYSSVKTEWKEDGDKHKTVSKNVYVRPFTIDLMATIRTDDIGVYFKYTPFNVLKDGYGLKFHSMSLGFYF